MKTLRAVRSLGISRGNATFLGLPDGRLAHEARRANCLIEGAIRRAPKPLLVIAPSPSDDHPDHRIVAAAVGFRRHARVRRLTYLVWPAGHRDPSCARGDAQRAGAASQTSHDPQLSDSGGADR